MKTIKILFIMVAFTTINKVFCQNIVCDSLSLSLIPVQEYNKTRIHFAKKHNETIQKERHKMDESLSDSILYVLDVSANINIADNDNDTILLATERFVGVQPATIKIYDGDNIFYDTITKISILAVQQPIPLNTRGLKNFKCELNYAVAAVVVEYGFGNFSYDNYPNVIFFQTDFGGNILPNPVNKNITYKNIYFKNIPDNFLSFSSFIPGKHDNTLDITFIDKNFYLSGNYETGNLKFNIYFPDTTSMIKFDNTKNEFFNKLSKLNYNEEKTIDVILAYWSNEKLKAAFGKGFKNYLFCDTSFISGTSLTHETLHMLYPIKTDKQEGQFFIGESIIEWLANYLMYSEFDINKDNRESFMSDEQKSLYDLKRNDKNSWYLIYNWGPHCIQQLANKTDAEILFKNIIEFLENHKHQTVSYQQFIDWLYNYFSKEDVDTLDNNVKSNINI